MRITRLIALLFLLAAVATGSTLADEAPPARAEKPDTKAGNKAADARDKAPGKTPRDPFSPIGHSPRKGEPSRNAGGGARRIPPLTMQVELRGLLVSGTNVLAFFEIGQNALIMVRLGDKFQTRPREKTQAATSYVFRGVGQGKVTLEDEFGRVYDICIH